MLKDRIIAAVASALVTVAAIVPCDAHLPKTNKQEERSVVVERSVEHECPTIVIEIRVICD